ncbi:MAG: hypothetical protein A3F82_07005 [Deltaproteobacteria bacterium RIFCSPLOWO2_12_FULL_44_12]|nr:MAG: hypothetical protein A2712_09840 [Deltaproteobacteria bacterium RIFCSPHIGHO2_01_FULL_43_49]OGQ15413.1 MAG: hypothetical protein A3D22_10370 [Deltaproteobacteria bacterium RIFCSPHIGHO2_02_FULL_44_53]OGQ29704.1 MAG: hypothetical protein A3D98_10570 [Deltaproteobacteria bacterium RIFCSPHIGHO2_12_FULL_44_21]OGQ32377.1 MAG: hypothetical protein A2979_00215 [Deltaproteobacteria bacterium RIFCSPLOWO2_01_FULL_45_74]OGQ43861.1 MAG: hypothetical protein A3I70_04110 [Deltaproteobacteria bacterium 
MPLDIVRVEDSKNLSEFIRFPHALYTKDPHWVPPLEFERRKFFNPKTNPFYKMGQAQLFLAKNNGKTVGRISTQVHKRHLEVHQDEAGFFGFFESIEECEVAQKLLEAAQEWLHQKGMKKIRGPFNFTINDEMGILVDGFDTPPVILMTHNPPYYASLLEHAGFKKAKDVYAYHYDIGKLPEQAVQLAEAARSHPGLTIRSINMNEFEKEIRIMMQIFNEAWAQNWGFIPLSEEEITHVAKDLKPIVDSEMIFFAFVDGEPAAFSICLPNINEAIHDLKGKLFPFGWAKLLWRLKRGLKSIRLCLMGIRKPYRGGVLGALSVLLNVEMHRRGAPRGYKTAELGWTLEDNDRINRGIEFMGGKRYKTYRIYEKEL